MRVVVEVGVVVGIAVGEEGTIDHISILQRLLTRPTDTNIPAVCIDIGTGLRAHMAAADTCPEMISLRRCRLLIRLSGRSSVFCRLNIIGNEEVHTLIDERRCSDARLGKGLRLLDQLCLLDNGRNFVRRRLCDIELITERYALHCRRRILNRGIGLNCAAGCLDEAELLAHAECGMRAVDDADADAYALQILRSRRGEFENRSRLVMCLIEEEIDVLDAREALRLRYAGVQDERIARTGSRRAARNGARDGRLVQMDEVVLRRCTATADNIAPDRDIVKVDDVRRSRATRGHRTCHVARDIGRDVDGVLLCIAGGITANCIGNRAACDVDRVLGRLARRRCCIAAVDSTYRGAINRDTVVMAVILLCRQSFCIRAGQGNIRVAAVGIRVAAPRHGDIVLARRVAHLRDAAVDIRRTRRCHRSRHASVLIALRNDLRIRCGTILRVDVVLGRIVPIDLAARTVIGAAEGNTCTVLHQRDRGRRCAGRIQRLPVERICAAREREHRSSRIRRGGIEVHVLERRDIAGAVRALHRQRIARGGIVAAGDHAVYGCAFHIDLVVISGSTLTAGDIARDGHGTEINRVVRGSARRGGTADHVGDRAARHIDRILRRRARRRVRVAAVDGAGDVCTGNRDRIIVAVVLLCRVCLRIRAGQRRNRVRIAAVGIRVASARHGDIVLPRRVGNPRDTTVHIRADRGHGVRLSAILIALCNDLIVRSRTVLSVDIELRCIGRVNSAVRAVIVAERNARAVLHQCDGTCGRADCLKRLPVKCGCTAREREHRIRRRSADIEFQFAKAHEAARRVCIPDRQFMTRAARRAARDGAGNGRTFQIDLVIRCGRTLTAEDTAHGHATLERNLVVRGCTT